jgi:transposase
MTQRKQFTPEFKTEIAKLMVDQNDTLQEACKAADAGESAVRRWRAQYLAEKQGGVLPTTQPITPEQIEIRQLKQRIKQLETEKDILKKATGDSTGHCNTTDIFCAGAKKFNVFLGRSFNSLAIVSSCSCE